MRVGSLSGGVCGAAAASLASVAAPLNHLTLASGADALALLSASLAGAVATTARHWLLLFVLALPELAPLPLLSAAAALAAAFWEFSGHQHPVRILPLRQLLPL